MTTMHTGVTLSFEERFTVALMRAEMNLTQFAEHFGTTRKTLWRWATLRDEPKVGALRVLAFEAGVPYEWLRPSAVELAEGLGKYAPGDSNPEPAD